MTDRHSNNRSRRQILRSIGGAGIASGTLALPAFANSPQGAEVALNSEAFETYEAFIAHEHRMIVLTKQFNQYSQTTGQPANWVWGPDHNFGLYGFPDNQAVERLVSRHSQQSPMQRARLILPALKLNK